MASSSQSFCGSIPAMHTMVIARHAVTWSFHADGDAARPVRVGRDPGAHQLDAPVAIAGVVGGLPLVHERHHVAQHLELLAPLPVTERVFPPRQVVRQRHRRVLTQVIDVRACRSSAVLREGDRRVVVAARGRRAPRPRAVPAAASPGCASAMSIDASCRCDQVDLRRYAAASELPATVPAVHGPIGDTGPGAGPAAPDGTIDLIEDIRTVAGGRPSVATSGGAHPMTQSSPRRAAPIERRSATSTRGGTAPPRATAP